MTISEFRFGLERTAQITGLVSLAFVFSGMLGSMFVAPPLPAPPSASAVVITTTLFALKNALWHICMFVLAAALAAQANWKLFRAPQKPLLMAISFVAGLALSLTISIPFYDWVSMQVFGALPQKFNAGNLSELRLVPFLVADVIMTLLIAPVVEEFAARGVLAERMPSLPRWQIAFWCVTFFCIVHYLGGGLMKIAAVLPMSIFFTGLRMATGSWKYPVAAHAGANLASALIFYRFV